MKIGLAGYGKMGRNIFSLLSEAPVEIVVLGRDAAEMDRQNRRLEKRLSRAVQAGMLASGDVQARLAASRFTTDWQELHGCNLVIETVREDFAIKVEVLRRAEAVLGPDPVLATNTSSLSITRLAERLDRPGRFCGFHFFHPIQLTTVVEIITGPQTSAATVDFLRGVSRTIGRTPLVVKDLAGSCFNVPLTCHTCEALYILEQGLATPSRIDAIAGRFARLGPCEALDTIGVPFFTSVLAQTLEAFGLQMAVPDLCHRLIQDGRTGKYGGRGVYVYRDDRPVDDIADYYVNASQTHTRPGARSDDEALYERLLFPIYFAVLKLAHMRLGSLEDLCAGITDMVGLKIDPLQEMRALGSRGLREVFGRLGNELGPRFDPVALGDVLTEVDRR